MKKNNLEKIVGMFLILFGCIFIFMIGDQLFKNSNWFGNNISNHTGISILLISNVLIIMTGAYLIKNKNKE